MAAEETMLRALVDPSLWSLSQGCKYSREDPGGADLSYVVNKTEIMTSLGFQHIDDM